MLGHRLRRWPSIETALGECLVLAGQGGDLFIQTPIAPEPLSDTMTSYTTLVARCLKI